MYSIQAIIISVLFVSCTVGAQSMTGLHPSDARPVDRVNESPWVAAGAGPRQRSLEHPIEQDAFMLYRKRFTNPRNTIPSLYRRDRSNIELPDWANRKLLDGRKDEGDNHKTLLQRAPMMGGAVNQLRGHYLDGYSSSDEEGTSWDAQSAGASSRYTRAGETDDEEDDEAQRRPGRGTNFGFKKKQPEMSRSSSTYTLASTGSIRPKTFCESKFLAQGQEQQTVSVVAVNGWVGIIIYFEDKGILGVVIRLFDSIVPSLNNGIEQARQYIDRPGKAKAYVFTDKKDAKSLPAIASYLSATLPGAEIIHRTYSMDYNKRGYWIFTGRANTGKTKMHWLKEKNWRGEIEGVHIE